MSDCKLSELNAGWIFLPSHEDGASRFLVANHRSGPVGVWLDEHPFRFESTGSYEDQDGYTISDTRYWVDTNSTSGAPDSALPLGSMVLQFEAPFIVAQNGQGERHILALGKGHYDKTAPRVAFLSWRIVFREQREDITLFSFDAAAVDAATNFLPLQS